MEVGPYGVSLAEQVERGNIVVLRSFGKFYGLAGFRLSFAIAPPEIATRLAAAFGPWPVSGAALAIGTAALADMRGGKRREERLPRLSHGSMGCSREPGLTRSVGRRCSAWCGRAEAARLFHRLGEAGILVRRYADHPAWLRFGLPGRDADWHRLGTVLASRG